MRIAVAIVIAIAIVVACLIAYREHVEGVRQEELAFTAQMKKAEEAFDEIMRKVDGALAAAEPAQGYLDRAKAAVRKVLGEERAQAVFQPKVVQGERPVLVRRPARGGQPDPAAAEPGRPMGLIPKSVLERQHARERGDAPPKDKPQDAPLSLIPTMDKSKPGAAATEQAEDRATGMRLEGREKEIVDLFRKADDGFRAITAEVHLTKALQVDIRGAGESVRACKTSPKLADRHTFLLSFEKSCEDRAKTMVELIVALQVKTEQTEKAVEEALAERERIRLAIEKRKAEEAKARRVREELFELRQTVDGLARMMRACTFATVATRLEEKKESFVSPQAVEKADLWIERCRELQKLFEFVIVRAKKGAWAWGWRDSRGAQDVLGVDETGVRIASGVVRWEDVGPARTTAIIEHYVTAEDVPDRQRAEVCVGAVLYCQLHDRAATGDAYERIVRLHGRDFLAVIERLKIAEDEIMKVPAPPKPGR